MVNEQTMTTGRILTADCQKIGDWGWYVNHCHHDTQNKCFFHLNANAYPLLPKSFCILGIQTRNAMKQITLLLLLFTLLYTGCETPKQASDLFHFKMEGIQQLHNKKIYYREKVYLPVYADVYHIDQSRLFPLTATISLRNTSISDSVYIYQLKYYNTKGKILKEFMNTDMMLPLGPLETYDLVINNKQFQGGTGANFIVEWGRTNGKAELLVQAVMVSTSGQQGLSFITEGHVIEAVHADNKTN